ncbi:hypothetical protein PISMIDRAFT_16355 [Pisolithus microcarpus 441]|uniref:Uncharacterized protein n=1 Tax=Pisolithus microcarpus 441 TaxID=765257 RepID=A0A0C9Z6Z2_9AGAM|nr:hypothetical protein PISMIDRAFT_16355 [Pisolithus microcarpus 441]
MSSTPSPPSTTCILNVVDNVIYVEVTGSLSKWDTHCFSVNIPSPGVKKVVLHLKDTVDNSLSADRKCTLEEEALEDVEAASAKLRAAHAVLWKAYEGTIGIQDTFTRVVDASSRLDAVCNKLSVLRDAKEPNGMVPVKAEDVGCEPNLELGSDGADSQYILLDLIGLPLCFTYYRFESPSVSLCRILSCYTGNPNPDAGSPNKPWVYHVIPFEPSDIPTQLANRNAKRQALIDTSPGHILKHAKLES